MLYQIITSEQKQTQTGKTYKKAFIKGEDGQEHEVSIWSDYPQYLQAEEGNAVEGEIRTSGQYKNLVQSLKQSFRRESKVSQIGQMQANKARYIEQAQSRKDESIAFFNATNSAIEIIKAWYGENFNKRPDLTKEDIKKDLQQWRDWFIKEWQQRPPFV